ncbi:patatin-like phospholipase family protein [Odoribacter lunatus]|uniref:patatin-like phospholipase family protein n=1 Tax=Odoribacter lunatus TaxID=2941335 RepID=UPI00203CCE70|nr:patatin-like phospholipase family protein [Odoribacter lunatus]
MRKTLIWAVILFLACHYSYAERKKVGLVLSGGGAKGVAHIGALKVLEEAGIPIDYIAGTSMGSIVGGLYAIGYDAAHLDSLVRVQNWPFLLSNKVYRYDLPFSEKEKDEKYLLSIPMLGSKLIQMPVGFISGQNIYSLFSELTIGYHDSLSFADLPIPFSCVAADLVDGKEIILDRGNLSLAMRASMAIPGVFSPVIMDSMMLVDGGIANNYPVDVLRAMGADIIIGVDVSAGLRTMGELNSVLDIVDQLTNFMGMEKYEENIKLTDLYIKPDITPYSAASFEPEAIDTLILRGETAARAQWEEIIGLKEKIGIPAGEMGKNEIENLFIATDSLAIGKIEIEGVGASEKNWVRKKAALQEHSVISMRDLHKAIAVLYGTGAFSAVDYRLSGRQEYDLTLILREKGMSTLNLGFRFDTEEMAAILVNTTIRNRHLRGFQLSVTGRLGMNPYARVEYSLGNTFLRKAGLAYMYKYNDIDLYRNGYKVDNVTFSYHMGELAFSDIYLRNLKFELGFRYEYFDFSSFLYAQPGEREKVKPEGFLSYYGLMYYETYDQKYYPERGWSLKGEYSLYTSNGWRYDGGTPFSALSGSLETVLPVTRRFVCLPSLYGRVLIGKRIPYAYLNNMGGMVAGRYFSQQLPFVGIHRLEMAENSLLVGSVKFRYRLGRKNYLTAVVNYAKQKDNFFDILSGSDIWGGGISYSYNTLIGPVDLWLDMSNWNKTVGVYFNLGYYF